MTPEGIAALVASGESEAREFKATTGTRREAAATVCAMLNQRGGHVLFGIAPDGRITGQQVSEQTVTEVSVEIQRIEPPAFPEIERIRISGDLEVIAVRVSPGTSPPYQYRGIAYLRVGNTTQTMSAAEYNRVLFERMHNEQRWENRPADGWTVDDLDAAEIRNTVAEAVRIGRLNEPGGRAPEDLLRGLGLLRGGILLRAAAVLFGNTERIECEMPQCLLRVARFRGSDRSEFLDNRQFNGNTFTLLTSAERFLRDTLPIASRFESGRMTRIDEPLYPPLATREALANALCHRDYALGGGSIGLAVYDDCLEVTSTGPLHFGLTPNNLFAPHESRPWNPLIARTFYRRGIIEEWGRGTIRMADLAISAGLPRPEIEERSDCVTVRFRRADYVSSPPAREERLLFGDAPRSRRVDQVSAEADLTEQQNAILALLHRSDRALALREIRSLTGQQTNERRLRQDLVTLKARGLVESTGRGRSARWKPL